MKRLLWVTDTHLNFCQEEEVDTFLKVVGSESPDAVLIGGDIGVADSVEGYLRRFAEVLGVPCFFVLGNHDFYGGSIGQVRESVSGLCRESELLHWLPKTGIVELDQETCLIGHGGWGDGRIGSLATSQVELNDFRLIRELKGLDRLERYRTVSKLGDEAADHFRKALPEALERYRNVIVLTHVPPWKEACWHEGQISGPDWLPFFTCWAVGVELRDAIESRPEKNMLVLCGHTHSGGEARVLPNLTVLTGPAEYGRPGIQGVIELGGAASAKESWILRLNP